MAGDAFSRPTLVYSGMSRKFAALLLALTVSTLLVYSLWPSDEARIIRLVKEGAQSVEREDVEGVMSLISFSYRDGRGLNYMLLKKTLKRHFDMYSEIEVEYEGLTMDVGDGRAGAEMLVRVLASEGGMRGYIFGDLDEPLRLRLELEKSPAKKWLVTRASPEMPEGADWSVRNF